MDNISFIFWEVLKVAGLAFAGLLAAKALARVGRPKKGPEQGKERNLTVLRGALYAALLILVGLGARVLGQNWAAAIYFWAGEGNLERSQVVKACDNAQRAVNMRPKELRYWRLLERARVARGDYASVLRDESAIRSLTGGSLTEDDAIKIVACHFALGDFDQVISGAHEMILKNHDFPTPYVLQGSAYLAEKKYGEAEKSFLGALQLAPTQIDAVTGLARAYFLAGEKDRALTVLRTQERYPLDAVARQHIEDLKAQYGH